MSGRMIMTKAPLRITFVGGGTDLSCYYNSSDYDANESTDFTPMHLDWAPREGRSLVRVAVASYYW